MMEYKGYRAVVSFDYDGGVFHGEVVDTRDVIFFEGTTVTQLQEEFQFSVDDYLTVCAERGREPGKPFSGKIPLRIRPRCSQGGYSGGQGGRTEPERLDF